MKLRTQLAAALALVAITPAFAQVKINDTLSVTGWATGSYQYTNTSAKPSVPTSSTVNVDNALLGATITPTKDVSAVFSLYYQPSAEGGVSPSGAEATLLDAYVTYTPTAGVTLTAGKFLSYMGFESFYRIQLNAVTLANQQFLSPIAGYHEGVKIDYSPDKTVTTGVALLDSYNSRPGYSGTEGDGELKHNFGAEAYVQYTGIDGLTLWLGYGYDSAGNDAVYYNPTSISVYDLWASYNLGKNDVLAAEWIYQNAGTYGLNGDKGTGSNWLVEDAHNFSDKLSLVGRISGEEVKTGPKYVKYTISPTYAVTANLSGRLEYSYTSYSSYSSTSASFFGAEVLFKF